MWGTDGEGHVHSKHRPVMYKQHEGTYTQKSHYCSSCQNIHRCGVPASWATRHTTVCLDSNQTWLNKSHQVEISARFKSHQDESSAGLFKIHQGYYESFLDHSAWLIAVQ